MEAKDKISKVKIYLVVPVLLFLIAFIINLIFKDNNHPTRWVEYMDGDKLIIEFAPHMYYGVISFIIAAILMIAYHRFLKRVYNKREVLIKKLNSHSSNPISRFKLKLIKHYNYAIVVDKEADEELPEDKQTKEYGDYGAVDKDGCLSYGLVSIFATILLVISLIIFLKRANYGAEIDSDVATFGTGIFKTIEIEKANLEKIEIDVIYAHKGNKEYYRFIQKDGEEKEVFLKSWRHFEATKSYFEDKWGEDVIVLFEDD